LGFGIAMAVSVTQALERLVHEMSQASSQISQQRSQLRKGGRSKLKTLQTTERKSERNATAMVNAGSASLTCMPCTELKHRAGDSRVRGGAQVMIHDMDREFVNQ
jgi:hypothetical protein